MHKALSHGPKQPQFRKERRPKRHGVFDKTPPRHRHDSEQRLGWRGRYCANGCVGKHYKHVPEDLRCKNHRPTPDQGRRRDLRGGGELIYQFEPKQHQPASGDICFAQEDAPAGQTHLRAQVGQCRHGLEQHTTPPVPRRCGCRGGHLQSPFIGQARRDCRRTVQPGIQLLDGCGAVGGRRGSRAHSCSAATEPTPGQLAVVRLRHTMARTAEGTTCRNPQADAISARGCRTAAGGDAAGRSTPGQLGRGSRDRQRQPRPQRRDRGADRELPGQRGDQGDGGAGRDPPRQATRDTTGGDSQEGRIGGRRHPTTPRRKAAMLTRAQHGPTQPKTSPGQHRVTWPWKKKRQAGESQDPPHTTFPKTCSRSTHQQTKPSRLSSMG